MRHRLSAAPYQVQPDLLIARSIIEPLLPASVPRPRGGRPRTPDRAAPTGILFVLRTGLQWEMLPLEMECGSSITWWCRLRDWQERVFKTNCAVSYCVASGLTIGSTGAECAWTARPLLPTGGHKTAPNPTDKGRLDTKRHLITDRYGIPLAFVLTGANTHDSMPFGELLDSILSTETMRPEEKNVMSWRGCFFVRNCRRHRDGWKRRTV